MKNFILQTLTLLAFSTAYCADGLPWSRPANGERTKADPKLVEIDTDDLCQHWVHSREEEGPGDKDQIFRPADSKKFPPSRFRMAYKFAKNGDCEWFYLSPTDAHHFKSGKWTVDPKDKTVIKITTEGTTTSFKITELTKEILRLIPIE